MKNLSLAGRRTIKFSARVLTAATALLGAACASNTPPRAHAGDAVRIERDDREYDLGKSIARIEIVNPYGEINVRGRDEPEVAVHAVVQRLPPSFARPTLTLRREGDVLRIVVASKSDDAHAGRLDMAVYVPAEYALSLRTRSGRIDARKRSGAIVAETTSGPIHVSTRATFDVRTDDGVIHAVPLGGRWEGASSLRSARGQIVVAVPTYGDIDLSAETSGALGSDFGIAVRTAANGRHEAHARYGRGGAPLAIRSDSGEIVLEQQVRVMEDTTGPEDDD